MGVRNENKELWVDQKHEQFIQWSYRQISVSGCTRQKVSLPSFLARRCSPSILSDPAVSPGSGSFGARLEIGLKTQFPKGMKAIYNHPSIQENFGRGKDAVNDASWANSIHSCYCFYISMYNSNCCVVVSHRPHQGFCQTGRVTCGEVLVGQKSLLLATNKGPRFRVSVSHLWCWLERLCWNYPDSDIIIPQPAGVVHKPPKNPESCLPRCFLELCRQIHKAQSFWQSRKTVVSSVSPTAKGGPAHYWILEVFG